MHRTRLFFVPALIGVLLVVSSVDRPHSAEGAFPGLNGKIIFESTHNATGQDFYTVNPDGTGLTQMVNSTFGERTPAWSPDGTMIAFSEANIDLYVMDLDGSGVTNITNSPSVYEFSPAWSPDGASLAFVQEHGPSHFEVHVINVDGTGLQQLTNNGGYNIQPAWSPDGTKIAFASNMGGTDDFEVYAMNPDGTGQANITNNPSYDDGPDWSPDGTKIAFGSDRTASGDIYVMDADGANPTQLTTHPDADFAPSWSPDGTRIAFTRVLLPQVNYEIFAMDAGGGNEVRLTNHAEYDGAPDWQAVDDTDLDGCADQYEVSASPALGGMRDAANFWDWMDVPMGTALTRDQIVSGGDIASVVARIGANDSTPGDFDRDSDPLSTPNPPVMPSGARQNYHPAYDRGGTILGGDPWDLLPPNGAIDGGDIAATVIQFGHRCSLRGM